MIDLFDDALKHDNYTISITFSINIFIKLIQGVKCFTKKKHYTRIMNYVTHVLCKSIKKDSRDYKLLSILVFQGTSDN